MRKNQLIAFGAILACLIGCVDSSKKDVLRIQLASEPASLDPSTVEDGLSYRVLSALMSGLFHYNENYELTPVIAESIQSLENGHRYLVQLRPWFWSDGKQVTAQDFVYGLKRTLNPHTPSKLSHLFSMLKNVQALSPKTLEFTLKKPVRFFPHLLTIPISFPQRKDVVEKWGLHWVNHTLSTGPYQLISWLHDQRIELKKNSYFPWQNDKAPEKINFLIVPEESTAIHLFDQGKLDLITKISPFDVQRLLTKGALQSFPYFATYYIAFNHRKKPWDNLDARLAVTRSINSSALVQLLQTGETVATTWLPPALLPKEAPHKKYFDKITPELAFDSGSRNQVIAEYIQSQLQQLLHLKIKLQNRDWKHHIQKLSADPPDFFRFGWLCPFVDAYAGLMLFESGNPNNYTGWKNPKFDALLKQLETLSPQTPPFTKVVLEAEKILYEQAVVIPIFHYVQTFAIASHVKNFWVNGLGQINFSQIKMD